MIKIIVDSQEIKDELLNESEYIHYLECIDSDKAGILMHIYLHPELIEIVNQNQNNE